MIVISLLLAPDTKWCPWDRSKPLWTDLLFAMDTDPKRTLFDPTKGRSHISQQARFAVEIAYRELPLGSVSHLIQRVCALLDNDSIPVPNDSFQFGLPGFENLFEIALFGVRHILFSLQLVVDSASLQCVVHACFQPASGDPKHLTRVSDSETEYLRSGSHEQ
jgi:hypothetical protein